MTFPALRSNTLPVPSVKKIKKPEPHWKHIVGLHVENQGDFALVWLGFDPHAVDKTMGKVTLYDSFVFPKGTHFAVIADGIKERGMKPVAWRNADEEFVDALRDRGCKMLHEGYDDTPSLSETNVRKLDERLATGTFVVLDTNKDWMREFETFGSDEKGLVPQHGFPLMSATRHALHHLKKARKVEQKMKRKPIHFGGSVV